MTGRNDVDTRIDRMCMLYGIARPDVYVLGKSMLTLFRDVFSSTMLDADDMHEKLCSDFDEIDEDRRMSEALTRLQFFATEGIHITLDTYADVYGACRDSRSHEKTAGSFGRGIQAI